MRASPALRRVLLVVLAAFLLWLAWEGLSGGVGEWSGSTTAGQKAQTVTQFAYGLFALSLLVVSLAAPRWRTPIEIGWVVSASLAAGLAPVVWGGSSIPMGIASGAATVVIALAVAWLLRVASVRSGHADQIGDARDQS